MARVSVRELARNTTQVIDWIARTGEAVLVMRTGLPVAAIVPIDVDALDAWILANAPDTVEGVPIVRAVSPTNARRYLACTVKPRSGRRPDR